MDLITKRAIGSVWHDRRLARTTQRQGKISLTGLDDRDKLRSLHTMTEFHQFKEPQDHNLEQTKNSQEPVMDTSAQNSPSHVQEPPLKAPTDVSAEDPTSSIEKAPYETVQQGPITYFRYYYEDAEQPAYLTPGSVEPVAKRNLLPLYLAGGGVLGATLISGVVIAGLANNSKPPSSQGVTQPDVKQTPKSNTTQPQVTPPEVMPQSRSTPTKPPQNSKKVSPKKSSETVPQQPSAKRLEQAAVQQLLAVPAPPPTFNLPPVPVTTVPVVVARSISKPLPSARVQPPAQAPQKSPSINPSVQNSPLPPARTNEAVTPPPAIVPPLESASLPQSTADARCLSPSPDGEKSAQTGTQSPPVQTLSSVLASENAVGTDASLKAQLDKNTLVKVAQTIAAQTSSRPDAEKELQAFLELPQTFPTSAGITILPLPCQIAHTAIAKQQMGEFAVLKLSPQEYQQRWKTSSKNPQALIPIYGFVDYKQQAIVLVQEKNS